MADAESFPSVLWLVPVLCVFICSSFDLEKAKAHTNLINSALKCYVSHYLYSPKSTTRCCFSCDGFLCHWGVFLGQTLDLLFVFFCFLGQLFLFSLCGKKQKCECVWERGEAAVINIYRRQTRYLRFPYWANRIKSEWHDLRIDFCDFKIFPLLSVSWIQELTTASTSPLLPKSNQLSAWWTLMSKTL